MKAVQFFAMLDAARKLQAQQYKELTHIQAISICSHKYYEHRLDVYNAILDDRHNYAYTRKKQALVQMDPKSNEAKHSIMGLFATQKRLMGYG